jgi:predicted ATPase/DNA-binding winged helix-turn-helix (wHTH) protein
MSADEPPCSLVFPPFRLDPQAGLLYCGSRAIELRPKAFALLRHLAASVGVLHTKEALLDSIWPDRVVSEGGLTELVRELRKALGDDAKSPRFIETVHGRGYRFIATPHALDAGPAPAAASGQLHGSAPALAPFVGRDAELRSLQRCLALAARGTRQLVFVTGEPGIGKTSLVEAFRRQVATGEAPFDAPAPWIARGQCIEQYGAGEAYLPILDAFGRLARVAGPGLVDSLRRYAPSWLVQLPALLDATELERLAPHVLGTTRERMLREMAEALEALAADRTLVLVLEDLHWSDYSTLDLLSFVAQREDRARLMIVATFRPVEVYARDHPLKQVKQELQARAQCVELPLSCLSQAAVAEYLQRRLGDVPDAPAIASLAPVVHRRTEGHPLFMVNVVDYVAAQSFTGLPDAVDQGIPDSVRQMIEKQIERLGSDEQRMLEVASVAGIEFSAASVAAGLSTDDADAVEQVLAALARRAQFIAPRGSWEWPDGTVADRHGFVHALYQNVLYFRIPPGRRARLHLRVGLREEAAHGEQAGEIAGGLALHFEEGHDYGRALRYLAIAGDRAVRRCANREAIDHYTRGISLLAHLPDSPTRRRHELDLQIALGPPLIHSRGYAADEVARTYGRARELHDEVGEPSQLLSILWGQWLYRVVRGDHAMALDIGTELQGLESAQGINLPWAHYAAGCSLFWLGRARESLATLEHGLARYEVGAHSALVPVYSQDPKAVSLLYRGWNLWVTGSPDQALESCAAAVAWADALAHPFSLAFALDYCAVVMYLRREPAYALAHAEQAIELSAQHGFPFWLAWGTMMRGWAEAMRGKAGEGIARLREGLEDYQATGAGMGKTLFLLMLADTCASAGRTDEGFAALAEGFEFCRQSGEYVFLPELHRIEGELILAAGDLTGQPGEDTDERAANCFQRAIDIARAHGASGWELRAATSLARLWLARGHDAAARAVLAPVHARFSEGFATRDLQDAAALLARAVD